MKKLLFVAFLTAGSAALLAQAPAQDPNILNDPSPGDRSIGPGDAAWRGITLQVSPLPAGADVGGVEPGDIFKPLTNSWLTYSGDLSGKRYSSLRQVNTTTVKNLSLKWMNTFTTGCGPTGRAAAPAAGGPGGGGGRGGGGGPQAPIVVGGFGNGELNNCNTARFGGGIVVHDGVIFAAATYNVFAIDARDGALLWQYYWKSRGGTALQTRGVGVWHNIVYFTLHDNWVVALDAKTGKEIWRHEIAPFEQQYFSSNTPMVIGDHILVGTGNDTDAPAFLKSLNPRTGAVEWIIYSTPQKEGDPGLETWASLDAARHGAGATWIPGSYDPETKLYIYGTGNPTPSYTQGRGDGDNLFTSSLLAVNVDTGKMQWYYQTSPHDRHDWDSTQTPILVDAMFNGRMRKLVMTATRNGYFFVLDRTTGEHLVTSKIGTVNNWAQGLDEKGQPKLNRMKAPLVAGALVNSDVLNYPPPTYSPDTGLFYVHEQNTMRISYLMDPDPRGSMGLGGTGGGANLNYGTNLVAIDYRTGRVSWRKALNGGSVGLLSTAGGLLFLTNGQNIEAWDARTGNGLWYSQIGGVSSPAQTFFMDGKQHMLFTGAAGMYIFVLN
jgi:alcohol dehydrogenase (cytochrome c)